MCGLKPAPFNTADFIRGSLIGRTGQAIDPFAEPGPERHPRANSLQSAG
jgi:hypothetical protein